MAPGWRILSFFGCAFAYKNMFTYYNAQTYGPIVSAFMRKHIEQAKTDLFDITDRKREYYEIDTSQYMNYTFDDLGENYHAHHGPQPDGESLDSTWLCELDKFLKGEENHLKEHKYFVNYEYKYMDKGEPTVEAAQAMFHSKKNSV